MNDTDQEQSGDKHTFWLKVAVTVVATALIAIHLIFPNLKVDAVTVGLLVVALIPWLAPIVKSVEVPGFKIELADVQSAAKAVIRSQSTASRAEQIGLFIADKSNLFSDVSAKNRNTLARLRSISGSDSNLALVAFRIEIEKRVRALAKANGIDDSMSLSNILQELVSNHVITGPLTSSLNNLISLGNKAAHGRTVDIDAGTWVLNHGGDILDVLDKFVAIAEQRRG